MMSISASYISVSNQAGRAPAELSRTNRVARRKEALAAAGTPPIDESTAGHMSGDCGCHLLDALRVVPPALATLLSRARPGVLAHGRARPPSPHRPGPSGRRMSAWARPAEAISDHRDTAQDT